MDPESQVIVMSGANEGILVAMEAFLDPGDEVIIPNPNWHHYKSCALIAGGAPVEVDTVDTENFSLRAEKVAGLITKKTKMICITSPGNPTGCVNTFIQHGAAAGLDDDQSLIEERIEEFAERRRIIKEGLLAIKGITLAEPMGAFYAFPGIKSF